MNLESCCSLRKSQVWKPVVAPSDLNTQIPGREFLSCVCKAINAPLIDFPQPQSQDYTRCEAVCPGSSNLISLSALKRPRSTVNWRLEKSNCIKFVLPLSLSVEPKHCGTFLSALEKLRGPRQTLCVWGISIDGRDAKDELEMPCVHLCNSQDTSKWVRASLGSLEMPSKEMVPCPNAGIDSDPYRFKTVLVFITGEKWVVGRPKKRKSKIWWRKN